MIIKNSKLKQFSLVRFIQKYPKLARYQACTTWYYKKLLNRTKYLEVNISCITFLEII